MTEEKENIWKKHCEDFPKIKTWSNEKQETAKKAYLAGYEQGYEDCRHYAHDYYKPKWHDLRKNPNDLPNQITLVIMNLFGNVYCKGWFDEDGWIVDNGNMRKIDCRYVIAWCEHPKFEE